MDLASDLILDLTLDLVVRPAGSLNLQVAMISIFSVDGQNVATKCTMRALSFILPDA